MYYVFRWRVSYDVCLLVCAINIYIVTLILYTTVTPGHQSVWDLRVFSNQRAAGYKNTDCLLSWDWTLNHDGPELPPALWFSFLETNQYNLTNRQRRKDCLAVSVFLLPTRLAFVLWAWLILICCKTSPWSNCCQMLPSVEFREKLKLSHSCKEPVNCEQIQLESCNERTKKNKSLQWRSKWSKHFTTYGWSTVV